MTDYVTRDDTNLGVGRILTSPTMYALYDNPTAITEGAAGAPRIQTAAIQDLAVTDAKLNATVTTAGTDWVLARNAGAAAGAVGTYMFARSNSTDGAFGSTRAGSTLFPTSAAWGLDPPANTTVFLSSGAAVAGTWRAMGQYDYVGSGGDNNLYGATLWLRIS